MKSQKFKFILLFVLLFCLIGYLREFIFVHYNNVMYQLYYHTDSNLKTPKWLQFLFNISYENLYYFKYPLTVLFAFIFFSLNFYSVKKLSSSHSNHKYVIYAYAVMVLIAALSMAYAYLFTKNLADDEYTLSRWLLGVAQSPIICLFLLASEKLMHKSTEHD